MCPFFKILQVFTYFFVLTLIVGNSSAGWYNYIPYSSMYIWRQKVYTVSITHHRRIQWSPP